jgi:hypothetical protein
MTQTSSSPPLWVYAYNSIMKKQSPQWKTPNSQRPKKAWQVRNNAKLVLIESFGIEDLVHKEFVPPRQIMNGNFWWYVLRQLRKNIKSGGATIPGPCTMTMRLTNHHSLGGNFWLQKKKVISLSLLTRPWPLWFFPGLVWLRIGTGGELFWTFGFNKMRGNYQVS